MNASFLQHFDAFVNKRKKNFGTIAGAHEYLLKHKFASLMKKHNFDDSTIEINHKKEELEIIVSERVQTLADVGSFLLHRSRRINEVSLRCRVANDPSPLSAFCSLSGVRSINHFDYSMRSIFIWSVHGSFAVTLMIVFFG
jgi:hypothetical protein